MAYAMGFAVISHRNEPRKNRLGRIHFGQRYDLRQYLYRPWRAPLGLLSKYALHIDAQMYAMIGQ